MEFKTEALEFLDIRLIDGDRGKNYPKSHDLSSDGDCLFLSAKNVTRNGFAFSEKMFITKEKDAQLRAGKVQNGDIVVTTRGTVGNIAFYDETVPFPDVRINSGMMIFRADLKRWNRKFLYFLMTSEYIKQQIDSLTSGSAVPQLPAKDLKKFQLPCIPINTQNAISEQIGAITDKINLNNRTNQTLEQMAQALFKSWFVDFDPVFDNLLASVDFNLDNLETSLPDELKQKAQRRLAALNSLENAAEIKASLSALAHELQALSQTKEATQPAVQAAETPVKANLNANPNILAQHANTHGHFPKEFDHNEQLGWIPKGWEVKELSQLVKHQKGFPFKSAWYQDEGHIVVRVSDTTDASINVNSCNKIPEELAVQYSSYALKENDLIIATVGSWPPNYSSVVGKVIRVPTTAEGGLLNQNAVKLTVSTEYSFHQGFLHFSLKNPRFMNYIINRAQGSANQASITLKSIFAFPILIASDDIMRRFSNQVKFNFDKQNLNDEEIQSLTRLRDTLLPKLISGELQIPDVATDEDVVD